ncbi:MAG: tRNA (adenosine(37)-N6)-dimethylallyltransferase MiaA [Polyangiaceae bacterium]|nr:tRNA (adenosine(37)-N6)-dimethylallyltransferase MiaA [Polyangiaceae bacterium]
MVVRWSRSRRGPTSSARSGGAEGGRAVQRIVVVVGATASGKTALAVRLAERLDGEIVSADSVQVYRRFDVGTGKPSAEERARARHHLVDVIEPLEPMDAARWATLAEAAIADIASRGKLPIVCGGTFLFVRALLHGLAAAPGADPALRARHQELAAREGRPALHAELARRDPASAARLHPNDLVRVSRALEVLELTGRPLGALHAEHGFRDARYAPALIGVARDGAALDERIARRVRSMLAAGWLDEVRALRTAGLGSARAMRSVGYRQLAEAIEAGEPDAPDLEARIVRATRVFARRQRTWLRDERVRWLTEGEAEGFTPSW